ncbi:YbaB/EbfC family nucleoid-associated protein [Chitinivibrio alkaliphilus]|uniref:Nucleoid-associated protein CALK_1771 n=1 Tax=Chitinivibrio alkaliphilus ACht1 TaxID=1313304 RepID=U7D873_9BACT|nr:YbaB/EbfC family nucleoid-associated protein [Chitinivibrio alkaliphilus]ERP31282.1 YbaB/EbfC DNA-binding family protein [Chitinivibrio alkaliphilus ACht1]
MSKQMNKMMKKAQKMQAQMMQAQEELAERKIVGTAGGGIVRVTLNGAQEMQGVSISPEAVDPDDVEMLEDLVLAAYNDANKQAKEMSEDLFGGITGGMNIPGL